MTSAVVLVPVDFEAPLVNPSPGGLVPAVSWTASSEPLRWLTEGIEVKPFNYGGDDRITVWDAGWCAAEADLTDADVKQAAARPDPLDPFTAWTLVGADECDLRGVSRPEVRTRVAQNFRLAEPLALETLFAARLLADAGTPTSASSFVAAVGVLEGILARTNTLGVIHAGAQWAAVAAAANLVIRSGTRLVSPLGHTWVFGGGYVDTLENTLVATSPLFGWRSEIVTKPIEDYDGGRFIAIAERHELIGYEKSLGAVEITR